MVQKRQRAEGEPSKRKSPRFAAAENPVKEDREDPAASAEKHKDSTAGDEANPKDLYAVRFLTEEFPSIRFHLISSLPLSTFDIESQVLGVNRDATHAEIRKAYHRMALRLHPDKNPGDATAKERFQALQRVFAVLGDAERRKIYDETGCTGDEDGEDGTGLSGNTVADLFKFFRTMYREITVADIVAFEKQYRGSEQEAKELKELYERFKGRMDMVLECQVCARPEIDSHRFKDILDAAIESGEVKVTKAYKKWAAEAAKKPAPADPLAAE
ncbi:unnamed protein product [Closterium sp. NIES-65]|nr:unnamed protein product [Closterium sp. NIES-65]